MALVVAAGALYAQADADEPRHAAVAAVLQSEREALVTTELAVAEADYLILQRLGVDVEVVNPEWDERYRRYWQEYLRIMGRRGITEQLAKIEMRRRLTLIGAMMVRLGDADGMICGTYGSYGLHLPYIDQVIGRREGVDVYAAMNTVVLANRQVTLVDTHVNYDPTAEELAQMTVLAASRGGANP